MAVIVPKQALESALFKGNDRLTACLRFDHAHILKGSSPGEYIRLIQRALNLVGNANLAESGVYDGATETAVEIFKSARQILNFQNQIDRIVGRKTISVLDDELTQRQRGRSLMQLDDDGDKPLDIVVNFSGVPNQALEGTKDEVSRNHFEARNTAAYLRTHKPLKAICFFGGRGGTDRSAEAADQVASLRLANRAGVTIVIGISVGGFAALRAASLMSKNFIRLSYVTINDGAFFQHGPLQDIMSFDPLAIRVPSPINAERKENFFQTFGHRLLTQSDGPGGFMPGTEFHGPLSGFHKNRDMATSPEMLAVIAGLGLVAPQPLPAILPHRLALLKPVASKAHVAAVHAAFRDINSVVNLLITP